MIPSSFGTRCGRFPPARLDPVVSPDKQTPAAQPIIGTPLVRGKRHTQSVRGFDPEYRQVILFAEQEDSA